MTASAPTLCRAFTSAVREHLGRLREGERRVREDGDLEGVHLMRTSCRRLRAAVKFLGDPLQRPERRALQDRLRATMGDLGKVRDLDVLRQALDAVPGLDSPEGEALREGVEEELSAATTRMEEAIDGPGYAELLSGLERAAGAADDGTPAAWAGPARIASALEGVLRLRPAAWEGASEESLHDLRKGVKRIRYALEAFAPAYGKSLSKSVERFRDLQESLGVIQDGSAFAAHLRGARTFAAGQFLATLRVRADAERERLPRLWERALGPKAAARLGSHLFRRGCRPAAATGSGELRKEAV